MRCTDFLRNCKQQGNIMLSRKNLLIVSASLMAMSAHAVVCEVNMVRGNGSLIQSFRAQGIDQRISCREAQKACRLDLRLRQRSGGNRQANCELVGVVDTAPQPTPRPRPTPRPTPTPPTGNFDYQLDGIASIISHGGWRARQGAVEDLTRYPTTRALVMAIDAISDSDSDVRNSATRSAKQLINSIDMSYETIDIMQSLSPRITGGTWKQRQLVAKTLGEVATAEALIPLLPALSDSDSDVRNAAQQSISNLAQRQDLRQVVRANIDIFATLASSGGWKQRQETVKVIGEAQIPKTITILVRAIGDSDSDVRNAAVNATSILITARSFSRVSLRVIDELTDLYRSGGWKVRQQAIKALGATHNQAARNTIIRALSDSDSDVRNAANVALRNL